MEVKSDLSRVKVPQIITIYFWIVKCCCTTVGESLSDYFNVNLGLGLGGAAGLFFPLLLANLCLQYYHDTYIPFVYWTAVVLMSICGTIATDGLHDNLGVELWIEVIVFFVLMSGCFYTWYRTEGTLDIHSINTPRRETFYWLTIFFTFALGTAIGDGISEAAQIGYGYTLLLFAGCIALVAMVWFFKLVDEVTSFWVAYIMTRPLGAAAGDLLASPKSANAAGLGPGITSAIFCFIIICCLIHLTYYRIDQAKFDAVGVVDNADTDKNQRVAPPQVQITLVPRIDNGGNNSILGGDVETGEVKVNDTAASN